MRQGISYKSIIVLTCAAMLALGGCSNSTKKKLGLGRHSPDEFTVVKRAPLSMPPVYNLRPPQPGAPRPQQTPTTEQAKQAVFGNGNGTEKQPNAVQQAFATASEGAPERTQVTDAEAAFLGEIGASKADPNIREVLVREQGGYTVNDENLADKIMFWRERDNLPPASVVDAGKEAERIKENKEEGKGITEGDVPVIEPKKRAPLEGLF